MRAPSRRRRTADPAEPITFEVTDRLGTVRVTARHLAYYQLAGLDAGLIGETKDQADPTGEKYLRERVIKLGRVTVAVDTGDPDDPDLAAAKGDWEKFWRMEGNEDLAWLAWAEYLRALDGTLSKSGAAGGGGRDGEGGGEAEPDGAAHAQMRAV